MDSDKQEQGLRLIHNLAQSLDLSREDIGTMLGVTGAQVVAWEDGTQPLPETVLGKLHCANNALGQLLTMFLPARLPQVIRRRADAFNGERALDWILDGRISDVAETYDSGLSYLQKTA
ncbi:MAG TPA: hypothetical protein VN428_04295 [Bryobacteraceae bacterium]|nr:hypothetical protein [Bryobacteraceae bacterium]